MQSFAHASTRVQQCGVWVDVRVVLLLGSRQCILSKDAVPSAVAWTAGGPPGSRCCAEIARCVPVAIAPGSASGLSLRRSC